MEITVNDITLYYTKTGHGQPLLLLHGNGEDHTLFDELVPLLADGNTVYALDSRDHGQSQHDVPLSYQLMADDVIAFCQQLQLSFINLVGFSDGAIVALLVASQRPGLVHKLVSAGGNLSPSGIRLAARVETRLQNLRHPDPKLAMMLTSPHIDPTDLHRITAQTFVIAGAKDVVKQSETVRIASAIPISILRIVPHATHSSYVKDNHQFFNYIGAFLAPVADE